MFDLGWIGSGWVRSATFGLGLGFRKFPLKITNFSIFLLSGHKKYFRVGSKSIRVKDGSAPYLLQIKSMLSLGQGPSLILIKLLPNNSDGFGSKIFDPGQVRSIFCGSGWVSHLLFGSGFGKFPPRNPKFFNFSLRVKKISLGRVKKCPGQRQVSLLFTLGQK